MPGSHSTATAADYAERIAPLKFDPVPDGVVKRHSSVQLRCHCGTLFNTSLHNVLNGVIRGCHCTHRRRLSAEASYEAAVLALDASDRTVLSRDDTHITWRCKCGQEGRSEFKNLRDGRACMSCKRRGRPSTRPAVILSPGTRHGDLEVIRHEGIVDGQSTTLVRNVTNGLERVILTCQFKTAKVITPEEHCQRTGDAARARAERQRVSGVAPHSATLTLDRVRAAARAIDMEVLDPRPDGELIRHRQPVELRCHCGNVFFPTCNNLMTGKVASCGCIRSKAQGEVNAYIQSLGFATRSNDRTVLDGLELDIYLPDRKIGVEYHGLHWHGEQRKREVARTETLDKMWACNAVGVRLIVVFANEWVSHQSIVEARLRALLTRPTEIKDARKLRLDRVPRSIARMALGSWHLQGAGGHGEAWGLWDGELLLCVATFARSNASRGGTVDESARELVRFVAAPDVRIRGGLSRLLTAYLRAHPEVATVLSYADRRWSDGGVYRACGFRLDGVTSPGYHYFKGQEITHRFALRKSELLRRFGGDPTKTEWELAQEAGYDRIWDLGHQRWIYGRDVEPGVSS